MVSTNKLAPCCKPLFYFSSLLWCQQFNINSQWNFKVFICSSLKWSTSEWLYSSSNKYKRNTTNTITWQHMYQVWQVSVRKTHYQLRPPQWRHWLLVDWHPPDQQFPSSSLWSTRCFPPHCHSWWIHSRQHDWWMLKMSTLLWRPQNLRGKNPTINQVVAIVYCFTHTMWSYKPEQVAMYASEI